MGKNGNEETEEGGDLVKQTKKQSSEGEMQNNRTDGELKQHRNDTRKKRRDKRTSHR